MIDDRKEIEELVAGYSALTKNMCNIIQYPDINEFNESQLSSFIKLQNLNEREIEKLHIHNDKNVAFKEINFSNISIGPMLGLARTAKVLLIIQTFFSTPAV